jgi:hypothetical protein
MSFQESMVTNRQQTLLRMAVPYMQANHHDMGLTPDPLASKGDLIDLDEALQFAIDHKIPRSAFSFSGSKNVHIVWIISISRYQSCFSTVVGISALRMTLAYLFCSIDEADEFSIQTVPPRTHVHATLNGNHLHPHVWWFDGCCHGYAKKMAHDCCDDNSTSGVPRKRSGGSEHVPWCVPRIFWIRNICWRRKIFAYQNKARAMELYASGIAVAKQFGFVHMEGRKPWPMNAWFIISSVKRNSVLRNRIFEKPAHCMKNGKLMPK